MNYKYIFDLFKFLVLIAYIFTPYLECSNYFFCLPICFLILKYFLKSDYRSDFLDDLLTIIIICIFLLLHLFQCNSSIFNILLIIYSNIIIINYIIFCCNKQELINDDTTDNDIDTDNNISVYINEIQGSNDYKLDNWLCVICLEEHNNDIILFKCGHYYHKNCITNWLDINNTCPICKQILEKPYFQNNNQVLEI